VKKVTTLTESRSPSKPGLIHQDKLCSITGLTDRRHRQLASQGYFPCPSKGYYETSATIKGMFSYYREQTRSLRQKQESLVDEEVRAARRRNRLAEKELVEWEWVESSLNELLIQPWTLALDNIPPEAKEWRDKVLLPYLRQLVAALKLKIGK
jgi:hypothetical protein